jgi:hypothetical protein
LGNSTKRPLGRHSSSRWYRNCGTELNPGHHDAAGWYANDSWHNNAEWNSSKHNHTRIEFAQRRSRLHHTWISQPEQHTCYSRRNARHDHARIDVTERYSKHDDPKYDLTKRCAGNHHARLNCA